MDTPLLPDELLAYLFESESFNRIHVCAVLSSTARVILQDFAPPTATFITMLARFATGWLIGLRTSATDHTLSPTHLEVQTGGFTMR
jgi:hypothetical protein